MPLACYRDHGVFHLGSIVLWLQIADIDAFRTADIHCITPLLVHSLVTANYKL